MTFINSSLLQKNYTRLNKEKSQKKTDGGCDDITTFFYFFDPLPKYSFILKTWVLTDRLTNGLTDRQSDGQMDSGTC